MEPAKRVDALAREWAEHCRAVWFSSDMRRYLDHPSYRELIGLGRAAVPAIIEHYRHDELPWEFVLQEITGLRFIEDPDAYSPAEVKDRWLRWWAEQQGTPPTGSPPPAPAPPGPPRHEAKT